MGAPSDDAVDDRDLPPPISASVEQLLDSAPDGVVVVDAHGVIRLVNRQAELMFGYDRRELIGQSLEILVPDRLKVLHPNHRAGYFAHPIARPMGALLTLAARRNDGSEFPVSISLSSVNTEDGLFVSAAVRDITDRKRIEANARSSRGGSSRRSMSRSERSSRRSSTRRSDWRASANWPVAWPTTSTTCSPGS